MKNYLLSVAAMALAAPAFAQGFSDTEVRIGLITDLSGPVIEYGNESRNAAMMAVEEVNAKGGVHGRQFKLFVEDNGYEPRKAVLAAQKLIEQDDVFAIVGHLGTATNMAVLETLIENEVYNFLPQGASPALYEPANQYKIGLAPSYTNMAFDTMTWYAKDHPIGKFCVIYQDDDYGRESYHGAQVWSEKTGTPIVEAVSYKRGATDFSSQVARLKAAACDVVQNSSTVRELVGSVTEANKVGFKPAWIGTAANYAVQAPELGGEGMNGVYASYVFPIPYEDDENAALAAWAQEFVKRYNSKPGVYALYSYYAIHTLAKVLEETGADLTDAAFAAALNATDIPASDMGTPPFDVSEDNRLPIRSVRVAQIQNGKWSNVSDWIEPADLSK